MVVARSGDLIASGMVLRTNLRIEPQEDLGTGQLRVNVKRGEVFQARAHVKVVGSGDGRIRNGDTDLRGIFVAHDLVGRATVIVKHDDEYAFYRGSGINQPDRFRPAPVPQDKKRPAGKAQQQKRKAFDAWEYNIRLNDSNRAKQIEWLEREVLQRQQRGVEVYRTK